MTVWIWSETDRPLVTVTPRIFNASTRWISLSLDGTAKLCLRCLSTKMISWLLARFSFKLLFWAQSDIWFNLSEHVSTLTAGIVTYVSSPYLHSLSHRALWPPKVLWGSTVGSDSLASCVLNISQKNDGVVSRKVSLFFKTKVCVRTHQIEQALAAVVITTRLCAGY